MHHDIIVPTSISSGASDGYLAAFEWTGTLDFSAYLSTMSALSWREEIGGNEVANDYMNSLCAWAGGAVSSIWGTDYPAIAPQDMFASMSVAELPPSAHSLNLSEVQQTLYDLYQIEVVLFSLNGKQYTRMSCHVYNYEEEYLLYAAGLLNVTTSQSLQNADENLASKLLLQQEKALDVLAKIREQLYR